MSMGRKANPKRNFFRPKPALAQYTVMLKDGGTVVRHGEAAKEDLVDIIKRVGGLGHFHAVALASYVREDGHAKMRNDDDLVVEVLPIPRANRVNPSLHFTRVRNAAFEEAYVAACEHESLSLTYLLGRPEGWLRFEVLRKHQGGDWVPLRNARDLDMAKAVAQTDLENLIARLAALKGNPRRSERGAPKRGYLETRRPAGKVPLTPSVFDKKNWFVDYSNERARSGVPFMDRAVLHLRAGNWDGREEQGMVYLDVALAWNKPILTRIGTFHAATITNVSFYYTPRMNSLLVTYDFDFDAERNHSARRAVVYGQQPRTLARGTRILEEHPRGPRGLEEAVQMARKDFEGRMADGTIKVGAPRYGFTETPKVLLSEQETRELLAARAEAMRADAEGYGYVHDTPKHIRELLIILRPDRSGNFGAVYRADVDAILDWYHTLPRY